MRLDPLYIQVLPRLAATGSSEHAQGVVSLESIDVGHRHFDVPEGISYDASMVNTGEAVLLSGTATATLTAPCDRCLEPTEFTLTGELQGYYLFEPDKLTDEEKLEVYESVDTDGRIDIAPPILAAIVFELPTVTLCSSDCKGVTDFDADTIRFFAEEESSDATDTINPASPFAALRDFKFEE